ALLPALHLDERFRRNLDLTEFRSHAESIDALGEVLLHPLLETGVGVDDVPLLGRAFSHYEPAPKYLNREVVSQKNAWSQPQRYTANTIVATRTTTVVPTTSWRPGHVTFFISEVMSRQDSRTQATHCFGFAAIAFSSIRRPLNFSRQWSAGGHL